MQRWEYWTLKMDTTGAFFGGKVDEEEVDRRLNEAGADGWELVTAFDTNCNQGASRHMVFTFKRPIG